MRDAGVHSGGCSTLPCCSAEREVRRRSVEKGIVEAAVLQGGALALLLVRAEPRYGWLAVEVHGAIFPEEGKPVKNLQRRVWSASACA